MEKVLEKNVKQLKAYQNAQNHRKSARNYEK
jgi:hypothetical protein